MTVQESETTGLVRRFYERGVTTGKLAEMSPLIMHERDQDAFAERIRLARAAFPDLQVTIDDLTADLTADSDRAGREIWQVVARVTARGSHQGAYRVTVEATDTFEIRGLSGDTSHPWRIWAYSGLQGGWLQHLGLVAAGEAR